ncbi:MAG: DUF763 domain-containing protein [Nitrospiraceae bacterium]|nr:MAG: DUF763 domain-containing protein [Nitrospiraceae bacterium]
MPRTGTATLPLHHGKAPKWLFERMSILSREIIYAIVSEFGQKAFLEKVSDPFWFQALGCVLGFDWHSSGLTTTVTGALKEGLRGMEQELGLFIAGGKGATSRKTPEHILRYSDRFGVQPEPLIYASRMSAKVDNTAVQDGYKLYHHVFVFSYRGEWAVVQQGMNDMNKRARRYHWLASRVRDFVVEPHAAVCCDRTGKTLNMVASESEEARRICTDLSKESPKKVLDELKKVASIDLSDRHGIKLSDIDPRKIQRILVNTYERKPHNFERLLGMKGVGPKTLRALSLVSEIVYGKPPSFRDPARFSFAHGGKDGTPFPVDRKTYDETTRVMEKAIQSARIGRQEKIKAVRMLAKFYEV